MGDSTRINRTLPSKDVADLLASFAPEVRNLAMPARTFVLEMIPTVTETVDAKARIIGYGYGPDTRTRSACPCRPRRA
jgi:hypothetical protein